MATLETQYKNYLKNNPDSKLTYVEWLVELSEKLYNATNLSDNTFANDISDWDVTLMDGLDDESLYISDDFQIDPDGAYEHSDREIDFKESINSVILHLENVSYNNGDLSDLGNEIGMAIKSYVKDITESEISAFIFGIKHGIDLKN